MGVPGVIGAVTIGVGGTGPKGVLGAGPNGVMGVGIGNTVGIKSPMTCGLTCAGCTWSSSSELDGISPTLSCGSFDAVTSSSVGIWITDVLLRFLCRPVPC